MAKKIISFLSMMQKDADKNDYTCMAGPVGMPVGEKVYGVQTNEAPVKALLLAHPDVSSIICIVTEETRNSNALKTFRDSILAYAKERNLKLTENSIVEVSYDNETQEFIQEPLKEILAHITAGGFNKDGDEILLDVTGGLRNVMMYLLLLSRILAYNNNRTIGAVYSVFYKKDPSKNRVVDCSELIRMFDLVGGMQELTSFGNVRTLRKYFGEQPEEPHIAELIASIEKLNEEIELCRANRVEKALNRFSKAVADMENCEDPLIKQLRPAFKSTFKDNKYKIRNLIRWCLERDMYQQAITLYVECIPTEIFKNIVEKGKTLNHCKPKSTEHYSDAGEFFDYLLNEKQYTSASSSTADQYQLQMQTIEALEKHFKMFDKHAKEKGEPALFGIKKGYEVSQLQTIARDYLYIKILRNMINHAQDANSESTNAAVKYLMEHDYADPNKIDLHGVKAVIERALKNLNAS